MKKSLSFSKRAKKSLNTDNLASGRFAKLPVNWLSLKLSWIWAISSYEVMINFLTVIVEWLIKTHMYPYGIRTINKILKV